jgi:hypothetical protein
MTNLSFNHDTDTFKVENEGRTAFVPRERFFTLSPDADLHEAAALAIASPNELIAVSNQSSARGLRPRASIRHGVIL